jgi:hypothetical protein
VICLQRTDVIRLTLDVSRRWQLLGHGCSIDQEVDAASTQPHCKGHHRCSKDQHKAGLVSVFPGGFDAWSLIDSLQGNHCLYTLLCGLYRSIQNGLILAEGFSKHTAKRVCNVRTYNNT